jgi:hypothetical protein
VEDPAWFSRRIKLQTKIIFYDFCVDNKWFKPYISISKPKRRKIMEVLRYVESPLNGKITINLPYGLRRKKKVEIIVLPYEDKEKRKKAFDATKFRGAGKLNMTVEEVERECQELRDEWNRNF